ncbi:YafQ toxin protein (plasmid) [Sinorhizobium sojae CCBAU 05684]|uniref:YafQ toxin protein n=1 Tax=Sinorhizobium sojae CCBAU 05684 TaxID=716928 RepID=A0A249PKT4_9HYPH|nr:YafQ toxin protein [Sinorhizobium sojae CCBAU 05684]
MRLVWARYALDDGDNIFGHIESENPKAAAHVDEEIVRAARRLLDFPESGRLAGLPESASLSSRARLALQPMW